MRMGDEVGPNSLQSVCVVYVVSNRNGILSAVIDLVHGYPEDDIWYLGLRHASESWSWLGHPRT